METLKKERISPKKNLIAKSIIFGVLSLQGDELNNAFSLQGE